MTEPHPLPHLQVRGLNGWYGESHVLHGVDIDVHEGETVTLLGRNGAGKTSTLRAITGLLKKREGVIKLKGRDLIGLPTYQAARAGIAYVPEERGIFAGLSVAENLTLPPKVAEGGMSVAEIYRLFPNLEERRNSQGTKLSGGEQQMLAMARVLRNGARLLLLDEPTEGLAPVIVQRIGEVLRTLKASGMTILLVEQNFRFARKVADRFYVMEHGRVVDHLTAAEVPDRLASLQTQLGV
ncbi:ABC transporter ATP-binding protein [Azorhizobium oxalatiphilum]|uniref:ABC transporter ATP-binding protein n=1 Tax=Azorhizobium oxalatiphilum TaxID=980631 RepID=A0A917C3H8_9HYPH|nr:ABC transporter ATP-binding protein [Azorhizobium oxalatiphilum]GGF70123.1 ABC transporter ATP-binding protein [Azorhizobium oxalatiphilum]